MPSDMEKGNEMNISFKISADPSIEKKGMKFGRPSLCAYLEKTHGPEGIGQTLYCARV